MNSFFKYLMCMATIALVTACTDTDKFSGNDSSGKTPIAMSVGIDESLNSVSTRATVDDPDTYSGFKTGSKVSLQVSGTWTNHGSGTVTKTSTGTTAVASDNKNLLTLANEVLYWDDYGTADATNESTGRANGLTIYGAAVDDGATTVAVSNWSALDCSVPQDQTSGWATKDLLISNNTKAASTYKFDNSTNPANLIFKHVLSKITVNLYKGDGFTDTEVTSGLSASVTVLGLNYAGTVNVADGTVTAGSIGDIQTYKSYGISTGTVADRGKYATFDALVVPNSETTKFANTTDVIKINVNNNIYYATGKSIVDAIDAYYKRTVGTSSSAKLESGMNYVFNIIVSKTKIQLSSTVVEWKNAEAAEITPLILTTTDRTTSGITGSTTLTSNFRLWYSNSQITGYSGSTELMATSPITVTNNNGTLSYTNLYWPNHTKGYFLRGAVFGDGTLPNITTDNTGGDYISVTPGSASANDLIFGTHINSSVGNNSSGALATGGKVILTFYHMMTQITVKLQTTSGNDKVNLGTGTTDQAVVKILNNCSSAKIRLENACITTSGGQGVDRRDATVADFVVNPKSTDISSADYNTRETFAIQQSTSNLKFQVTIKNSDGTTDTYTTPLLNAINVSINGGTSGTINWWYSGNHYTYTLTIKKSGVTVSATLVPWTEATGGTTVIL